MDDAPLPDPSSPQPRLARRTLLLGGAATLVLAACSSSSDDGDAAKATTSTAPDGSAGATTTTTAATTTTRAAAACVLSPEVTAGPYYLDGHLAREDITEGKPGTPLTFHVQVLGLPDCKPLAGAAVDIWHCDAGGEYSGWNGNSLAETNTEGRNDERYLRGVQLTDDDGIATFTTIFPGWYEGRAIHIHMKVIEGGTIGKTYEGGHVAHVGQAFFDEALTAKILKAKPYATYTQPRTTNDQDSIYAKAGPDAITEMTAKGEGWVGAFTCLVDPTATPPAAPLF